MGNTFFSYSFGCRVNHAEKELLDQKLVLHGWEMTEVKPQFYIINSCAITQKAEKEVRNFIRKIHTDNPKTKIVLTGCAATLWKKNGENDDLPIFSVFENLKKDFLFTFINKNNTKTSEGTSITDRFLASRRLVLKIQDGCNRYCSYCIVPFLRTKQYSKSISEIITEISGHENCQEVILTAINSELYGHDNHEDLSGLIDSLIKKTKVPRISFGSINPWSLNKKLLKTLEKYANNPRAVHFFHVPIQSGSDKILNTMKRDYSVSEISTKILALKKMFPRALIATDIIVGFPGETDRDFEDTMKMILELPINRVHVFRFSRRPGTHSSELIKQIGEVVENVKTARSKKLIELSNQKYEKFCNSLIGHKCEGLFTLNREGKYQEILLDNQIPARIFVKDDMTGQIASVEIIEYKKGKLFGKITISG